MFEKFRLATVLALLALTVLVDFTGKLMSIVTDGVLVGLALYFGSPLLHKQKN
ncbi:TPA: DUF3927 family protein [Enterobacter hormaechei]|uniref:DUF3927 family protein n=1 Tax=Enterobacter hormaechei TaxID=158836 RepID=UPI0006279EF5|nr:DUF3927 family protein [Enterobacter hormaechei]HCM9414849.1 DUF3927 family protein [Enterobacter hormaechei subsp. steigerwaltii]EMB8467715.1 DUF3927 family protein [Enterobacter hormaechei]KKJ22810.1 membrane protein [Enterobacter hormaechei subsp. hoffmannii]CZV16106.1 Uncharacterised protein [Enterobacter hormaechei]CZV31100.1 Uncharacterised protein [Enterobacter hormaechei]